MVASVSLFFFSFGMNVFAYSLTTVSVANDPRFMVVVGTKIYISHYFSGTVSILDTADNSLSTLSVPNAWVITTLGNKVYVAKSTSNKVAIIDTSNSNSISEVDIGGNPGEFATGNGNVYVANGGSNTVSVINGTTDAVEDIDIGTTAEHIAVIGSVVYVTGGSHPEVTAIDTANSNTTQTITVGSLPSSIVALGTKLYVTNRGGDSVSIIHTATANSVTTVSVGHFVTNSIVFGNKVYALNNTNVGFGANSISIIDGTTEAVSTVAIADNGNSNSTANASVLGTKIFIAYQGGDVAVFDTSDNSAQILTTIGNSPYYIVTVGTKVYVTNRTGDTITVIGPTYSLAYSAGSHGTLTGTASQTVNGGTDGSTVTAVPDAGYYFANWSDNSTQNPRTDTNVSGNVTVSAVFNEIPVASHGQSGSRPILYEAPPQTADENLSLGNKNEQVHMLQQFLNKHGYIIANTGPGSPGKETSLYGILTRNAVIRFQKDKGIRQTGIVGPQTRGAMKKLGA
jgi:YVTN family beta-propeller protein